VWVYLQSRSSGPFRAKHLTAWRALYKVFEVFIAGPDRSGARRASGARSEATERTRDAILAAAHECLSAVGLKKTSVEEVARRAGVSRGTVYLHFTDKTALLSAVLLRNGQELRDRLARELDQAPNLREQLVIATRFSTEPQHGELIGVLREREPEALDRMALNDSYTWIEHSARFWAPRLRAAQRRGEIAEDTDIYAAAEWVGRTLYTTATVHSRRVDITTQSAADIGAYVSRFLLLGIGVAA
jgi:AcrR family transcriptional regulator